MSLFDSLDEIPEYVIDVADGVVTVPMRDLRDAAGYSKLGKHVVERLPRGRCST